MEASPDRYGNDARWERWAGGGAIAYVVLTVVWALLIREGPGLDDPAQTVTSYYDDDGNRGQVYFATALLGLGGIAFLWFLGSLRAGLRRAEGGTGRLSAIAFAGGVVLASLTFVKNSIEPAIATAVGEAEGFTLDPNTAKLFDSFFGVLLLHESLAAAVLVGAASVIGLRTGLLPSWFAWTGVAVAIANVAAVIFAGPPLVLFLAWLVVAGVLVWRGLEAHPRAGLRSTAD